MYYDYGIAFDDAASWSFNNGFARNGIIFGVDNSSSFHDDNLKAIFFLLIEGAFDDFNGRVATTEKSFDINFSKAKKKTCLSLHFNGNNTYFIAKEKEIYKFLGDNKNFNSPTHSI